MSEWRRLFYELLFAFLLAYFLGQPAFTYDVYVPSDEDVYPALWCDPTSLAACPYFDV